MLLINASIEIIIIYSISIVFAISVAILLKRRRKRQENNYPLYWSKFIDAVNNENLNEIADYGSKLVWNDNLKPEHKKIIYETVENKKNTSKKLNQLWRDVYYKTHGLEPT